MIRREPTIIVIRTENRETYCMSSGAVSKVDMIRERREILIERAFTRPDHVSELRTDRLQYPTEREWRDARRSVLQSLNLTAYLSDSIPAPHSAESPPSRHSTNTRLDRMRNLWASLLARLNIRRRAG